MNHRHLWERVAPGLWRCECGVFKRRFGAVRPDAHQEDIWKRNAAVKKRRSGGR